MIHRPACSTSYAAGKKSANLPGGGRKVDVQLPRGVFRVSLLGPAADLGELSRGVGAAVEEADGAVLERAVLGALAYGVGLLKDVGEVLHVVPGTHILEHNKNYDSSACILYSQKCSREKGKLVSWVSVTSCLDCAVVWLSASLPWGWVDIGWEAGRENFGLISCIFWPA